MERITSISNLLQSEKRFLTAMHELGYGRFEGLRVERGELVLDPWPTTIRSVKFGDATSNRPSEGSGQFELKKACIDFFEHVRLVDRVTIRILEIRGGLPFGMEIGEETNA